VTAAKPAPRREFASDNHAGAHPEVLAALAAANRGHADSYGGDEWTARLEERFRELFGADARAFAVFNGTGANVLCLEVLGRPQEAVICSSDAHIHLDECGAPERITGMKLLPVPTEHGKLRPADLARWEDRRGDEHHVQPRIVSITQSTELGTLYSAAEIAAIADAAHELDMYVHLDGARIANAAVALQLPVAAFTSEVGVDAVSFGGTKNGLLFGEVAVFCGGLDRGRVPFARKQLMQLASKGRFISAQFEALLADELWLRSARHANEMAARLGRGVEALDGAELVHPVEANGVFVRLPQPVIDSLLAELPGAHPFYVWDAEDGVVRWMCSWDTTPDDVDELLAATGRALAA
jgi:threonine aldolase